MEEKPGFSVTADTELCFSISRPARITEGSASDAARELGQGWKVNPYLVLQHGSTTVLADIKGNGHYVGTYMHWGIKSNKWWGKRERKSTSMGIRTSPPKTIWSSFK